MPAEIISSTLIIILSDRLSQDMQNELLTTHLVFLDNANREIVKSTLGFIKLAIHTLPVDIIKVHLKSLVQGLMNWAHDHKNHFKEKVRHIFERLIRRFGWEDVSSCVSEDEDAGKFLSNIKKRKDRVKRKKALSKEADEDGEDEDVNFCINIICSFIDLVIGLGCKADNRRRI